MTAEIIFSTLLNVVTIGCCVVIVALLALWWLFEQQEGA